MICRGLPPYHKHGLLRLGRRKFPFAATCRSKNDLRSSGQCCPERASIASRLGGVGVTHGEPCCEGCALAKSCLGCAAKLSSSSRITTQMGSFRSSSPSSIAGRSLDSHQIAALQRSNWSTGAKYWTKSHSAGLSVQRASAQSCL